MENLQSIELIPFKTFKEKINITKKHDGKAKMEIIDNKYILLERKIEDENMGNGNREI